MKAKITIAGTLKPVSEPRSFEKIAKTLVEQEYQVAIIGAYPDTPLTPEFLTLYPHKYSRRGIARVFLPLQILGKIIATAPDILIVNTHELLLIGSVYKLFFKKKLIYDIRENYNFNLRYQHIYTRPFGWLLGSYIRLKERLSVPFIDYYFLAEQCYLEEMPYLKKSKTLVLENKYVQHDFKAARPSSDVTEFLLSGTISELYGALEAIEFLRHFPPEKYAMRIIGHCPDAKLRTVLNAHAEVLPNLKVLLSDEPVAHSEILACITTNTVGILPYRPNKSTQNKIPTKLYEYIGLGIPVIISPNNRWESVLEKYEAGIIHDFTLPPDIARISNSIHLNKNNNHTDLQTIMWNSQENSFLEAIRALLPKS